MKLLKSLIAGFNSSQNNKTTSSSNSRDTASPTPSDVTITTSWESNSRVVQNFRLIWLENSTDEVDNDDSINTITQLRKVANTMKKFTDADECMAFMDGIEDEKLFLICSGELGETTVPAVHAMAQIDAIYIFCINKARHKQLVQEWPKIKGVYADMKSICEALKQAAQDCDQNSISISFVKTTNETSDVNLYTLDQSFMYTQILKEILLTINFEEIHFSDFVTYCREQFVGNGAELKNVAKLQTQYRLHQPIWWYTYNCFLYSMLNRALRMMEVDLIIKMGFFVQDLHNHITALHSEQYDGHDHLDSFIVYRGQSLSQIDFDQLKQTEGGLLSFNNFLLTSLNRAVSLTFAGSNEYNPDVVGVLFEIAVMPSISSFPFANVKNVSYNKREEILFSIHPVFRIRQVKQIVGNNRLWQVDLTLTSDNDPQLHALTKRKRKETQDPTGWLRLGNLMIKLGQFTKAEELYDILLEQTNSEDEKAHLFHQLGRIKTDQGEYTEAIESYEKSIETKKRILSPAHPDLLASYNDIGLVYDNMSEYSQALSYYEKALEISQIIFPPNHPNLATSYNNIGLVSQKLGEYSEALSYYKKALEIREHTLPLNHPDLAYSYNNIALGYNTMGEYSKALSYYEKALEIREQSLSPNDPDLAGTYNNIGSAWVNLGEYSKALSYYEKGLEIREKNLCTNHPDLAFSYNNIGLVYDNMREYSKALSYYEKAVEIREKTLSAHHPDLATTYNNMGRVYDNMGEYPKALSYYGKALEIQQKTLPPNHPSLAIYYNNIGSVYRNMRDYSKTLSYYEKTLEIWQKALPPSHPNLGIIYNNIGFVYRNLGDYSKALSYYERALDIKQHSLPPNHSSIKNVRESIELVKKKL